MEPPLATSYQLMHRHAGHQNWWPGETPLEICIGAILTQNTQWTNVERAIGNLKEAGALDLDTLHRIDVPTLAGHIRPAGYFNVKARRLKAFVNHVCLHHDASLDSLFDGSTAAVREELLGIKGIGPETADSMLLYAGDHASFVVDAYTRRIFLRHGWIGEDADYHDIQALCRTHLHPPAQEQLLDYWQDYHAQVVMVGKNYCRPRNPLCDRCPLRSLLPN